MVGNVELKDDADWLTEQDW